MWRDCSHQACWQISQHALSCGIMLKLSKYYYMLSGQRMIAEVCPPPPSLPSSLPSSLPPSCPSGCMSSQTGVIELAVTDPAASTRTGWRELWSGLTERHTASGYSLYFCKCRWFLVLNNVLSAGCYLQVAEIEMYSYKEIFNVLFFFLRVAAFNDK